MLGELLGPVVYTKRADVERDACLGIDGRIQPTVLVINTNHTLVNPNSSGDTGRPVVIRYGWASRRLRRPLELDRLNADSDGIDPALVPVREDGEQSTTDS